MRKSSENEENEDGQQLMVVWANFSILLFVSNFAIRTSFFVKEE